MPLLQMRAVCHRLQNLILRIVHSRLLLAASLKDRKLILECYHPSAQYSEPYLYCDYLGTPGLSDSIVGQGSIFQEIDGRAGQVLRKLYSRFRPTRSDPQLNEKAPHPAGDIPGSRSSDVLEQTSKDRKSDESVRRIVTLDAHENFSQIVFNTDLVQLGPRRGMFLDIISVSDKKTLRIFRHWLAQMAQESSEIPSESRQQDESRRRPSHFEHEAPTIWIDEDKMTAGLKLRVQERRVRRDAPILFHRDEDQAVGYTLELQGCKI